MEGLAAAGGVIAVVSLAGQVLQGCVYLRDVFDNTNNAPKEIRFLSSEISIIERIIQRTPRINEHKDELDFCNERLAKLVKVVERYGEVVTVGQGRRWGKRLAMALNSEKISKHLGSLREAKGYLEQIQNNHAHHQTLVKSNEVLESVQQLTNAHSEAARIISRNEGTLNDIKNITSRTNEMASQVFPTIKDLVLRVVQREEYALARSDQNTQRMIEAYENMLKGQFSTHLAQFAKTSTSASQLPVAHSTFTIPPNTLDSRRPSRLPKTEHNILTSKPKRNPWLDVEMRLANPPSTRFREPRRCPEDNQEIDVDHLISHEMTSRYNTILGKVVMRTVAVTYSSLADLKYAELYAPFASRVTAFPVTITNTEILLLPESWAQIRGAMIHYQGISSPNDTSSVVDFQIGNAKAVHDFMDISNASSDPTDRSPRGFRKKLKCLRRSNNRDSALLLHTALRTASIKRRQYGESFSMKLSPPAKKWLPRTSFTSQIDDILELVCLWLASGSEYNGFGRDYSESSIEIERQEKATAVSREKGASDFLGLMSEYISLCVFSIVNSYREKALGFESLVSIHGRYWEVIRRSLQRQSLSNAVAMRRKFPSIVPLCVFPRKHAYRGQKNCSTCAYLSCPIIFS